MSLEVCAQVLSIFLTSAIVYVLTRPGGNKDSVVDWNPRDDDDRDRDGATCAPELTGIRRYSVYHRKLHRQKSISFSSSSPRDADTLGGAAAGLASDAAVACSSSSLSSRASDD
jgi:hypothetical protein